MRIHFIGIGGCILHELAIKLSFQGNIVTGSDFQIINPSYNNLLKHGLLPKDFGWFEDRIDTDIDLIYIGMGINENNPEYKKAVQLKLKISSFPEYIYDYSQNKTRIVIAGSHGKTTITSIIIHVLQLNGIDVDFLVGATQIGKKKTLHLNPSNKFIILEGDEYYVTTYLPKPKFLLYNHHIAVLNGIAWDHFSVYKSIPTYINTFRELVRNTPKNGVIFYNQFDKNISKLVLEFKYSNIQLIPYGIPKYKLINDKYYILNSNKKYLFRLLGFHNLINLNAAKSVCNYLGVSDIKFFNAIKYYKGVENRIQKLINHVNLKIFKDFAHSPSKVQATTEAIKCHYPDYTLITCLELYTYSSLHRNFIKNYHGCLDKSDHPIIYINPDRFMQEKMKPLTLREIHKAFKNIRISLYSDSNEMIQMAKSLKTEKTIYLFMSLNNFGGLSFDLFIKNIQTI
jgi:UDP-N-acetylmuramate: L-alanyl-gamma-D-glutamyl-meso-diaminopimelate ligase